MTEFIKYLLCLIAPGFAAVTFYTSFTQVDKYSETV